MGGFRFLHRAFSKLERQGTVSAPNGKSERGNIARVENYLYPLSRRKKEGWGGKKRSDLNLRLLRNNGTVSGEKEHLVKITLNANGEGLECRKGRPAEIKEVKESSDTKTDKSQRENPLEGKGE